MRRRVAPVVVLIAALVGGCAPSTADQRTMVVDQDGRAEQVRRARAALTEPVPVLVAETDRFAATVAEVWTSPGDSATRAARVDLVDPAGLQDAVAALEAVELQGDGPDVRAAEGLVEELTAAAERALVAAPRELADLPAVVEPDQQLAAMVDRWDEPGSFSQLLRRFDELETRARTLATDLDRPAAVPCTGVWERRVTAATVVAERTAALGDFVRRRDGDAFDAARADYRSDPLNTGGVTLGDLDAAAAADCWPDGSAVAAVPPAVDDLVDALEAALDPDDLRAPQDPSPDG